MSNNKPNISFKGTRLGEAFFGHGYHHRRGVVPASSLACPLIRTLGVIEMMPCDYRSKSGDIKKFDLDAVFELVGGFSQVRKGWTALIIFVPSTGAFVELRSSPQDYRGNSEEEAEEIDEVYIQESFGLPQSQVQTFKANPQSWQFIDFRQAKHGHA